MFRVVLYREGSAHIKELSFIPALQSVCPVLSFASRSDVNFTKLVSTNNPSVFRWEEYEYVCICLAAMFVTIYREPL